MTDEVEEMDAISFLEHQHRDLRIQAMGRQLRLAEAIAPTHPHPHGPDSAVGNLVVGPFVAIADRVRDAMHKS